MNIYWACLEKEWMIAEEPQSVLELFSTKNLSDNKNILSNVRYCPAFKKNYHNVFTMKSIYDYEFTIDGTEIYSENFDESFFKDHVIIRSFEKKFFSFHNRYIFFTDVSDLNVTFYEYPVFEDNNITDRCIPIAGQFNIAKWFRNTEFAFYLKNTINSFKIQKNEIYSYMRFHTEEKINFVQFRFNDFFNSFIADGFILTHSGPFKNLENYYTMFKNKKLILKEIEKNII